MEVEDDDEEDDAGRKRSRMKWKWVENLPLDYVDRDEDDAANGYFLW